MECNSWDYKIEIIARIIKSYLCYVGSVGNNKYQKSVKLPKISPLSCFTRLPHGFLTLLFPTLPFIFFIDPVDLVKFSVYYGARFCLPQNTLLVKSSDISGRVLLYYIAAIW